jgi:DNA mismatch repair protein MutS
MAALFREGYDEQLDETRRAARDGKVWVAQLEETERARSGIKNLKVGFNNVFGYYIEVTKSNLAQVPPEYTRKQTTANAERFVTPELKEQEAVILGAQDRINEREKFLLKVCARRCQSCATVARYGARSGAPRCVCRLCRSGLAPRLCAP